MTHEELNKRLRFCAEHGIPYSDKLWAVLCLVWRSGYQNGDDQSFRENCGQGPGGKSTFEETLP